MSSAQSLWHSQHHWQTRFMLSANRRSAFRGLKNTRKLSEPSILATRSVISAFTKISLKTQVHSPFISVYSFIHSFIPNYYAHLLCVKNYVSHVITAVGKMIWAFLELTATYSISHFKVPSSRAPVPPLHFQTKFLNN